ncbi:MAG: hypothetical protein V1840_05270 [Candidatus Omnitrophota bacterium]
MKALFTVLFVLLFCRVGYAQSTLEYATLLTRQAAAGANREKGANVATSAVNEVYSSSAGALSRGSALLQQAGAGFGLEPETKTAAVEAAAENESGLIKVYLKSGQVIEGKLVEQGDDRVKVESNGIVVTYFNEEIDKIA